MRAILLACVLLAGCATGPRLTEPKKEIVYVDRPVAVSCIDKNAPKRPAFTDTKAALRMAADADIRYQLLSGNWSLKEAYIAALEKQVDSCKKVVE